ncbi:class I SAM-dependent methyltransferase [Helicobacter sp. MIT 14-3879]|uniref:Eco57I restriction-modification methylase domain-containing protein n=1 Tax=Helicobacter sp. MIT 14-3879 TaxID=2040649 RepID=UPI000E1F81CD|nr:class I SAM-dependent methyltransferase [Helicobacter sp. MIT 14-3879]RDU59106.1 SAM-dependent methyltransferase [Helicobacter sp. MIT 14-3879]
MKLDIANLGQVFTPPHIVSDMLNLIQSSTKLENPRFLEPSCGNGAFFKNLPSNKIGIELDKNVLLETKLESQIDFLDSNNLTNPPHHKEMTLSQILNIDFFDYPVSEKFDCIIGNPPYVRYQDILDSTKFLLNSYKKIFDSRSNLYLFFIYKCILHLKDKGELVFITPRDFLKSTASIKLNEFIFSQGSITDFIDLGDKKIFEGAQPNCAIWRFEKGNFGRKTQCLRQFSCINGQILFTKKSYTIPFSSLFFVKVGAVSGADYIFANKQWGNVEFVNSSTAKSGTTKRMIYGKYASDCKYLEQFKEKLMQRKIKKFGESNWWEWGRDYYKSEKPRIYVNTKTRNIKPFFLHSCKAYDGSVLAIFPKFEVDSKTLEELCERLNNIDWEELGFVCDGRFLFSQRSLENCMLDSSFKNVYNIAKQTDRMINAIRNVNKQPNYSS